MSPTSKSDHDLIVETHTMLKAHLDNWETHKEEFKEHVKDDKKEINWIKSVLYFGFGVIAVLKVIFKI